MLSTSEQRFRSLVENVPGAVYRCHLESPWSFEHTSEAIFVITGYHAEQFMKGELSIGELIIPEDIERVIKVIDEGVKSRSSFTVEYGIRHKDGSVRHVLERGRAVLDNSGNPLWLDGVMLDTTDRWLAETERARLMKTIEARNRELQDIVYVASHDLKAPLVNISGFGNELADHCTQLENILTKTQVAETEKHDIEKIINEDIPESLEFINAGTDKINMLINGLLQVSRVGSVEFKIEPLDMNEIIKQIIETVGFQAKTKDISITADPLPPCMGDSPKTNQVFTNLINNAIKYLDPERKGEIHISGSQQGDESVYCIADNGIGISPQHQHRIFEVFHRLNPNDSVGGEGLGLTIVMRILDRQNGRTWLESHPDKGSEFYVALPTAQ
jgi:PAS domain S-box-containing protein